MFLSHRGFGAGVVGLKLALLQASVRRNKAPSGIAEGVVTSPLAGVGLKLMLL